MKTIITIEDGKVTIETDDGKEPIEVTAAHEVPSPAMRKLLGMDVEPKPAEDPSLAEAEARKKALEMDKAAKDLYGGADETSKGRSGDAGGVVPKPLTILDPGRASGVKTVAKKVCRVCSDEFVGTSNNQKSCADCMKKAKEPAMGVCENCSDSFPRTGRGAGTAKLCPKCREKGIVAAATGWCAICRTTRRVDHTEHNIKDEGRVPAPKPQIKQEAKELETPKKKTESKKAEGPFCIHCQDYAGHGTSDHPDDLPPTQKRKDMEPVIPTERKEPDHQAFGDPWNCQTCRDKGDTCTFHHKMENSGYKPPRRFP